MRRIGVKTEMEKRMQKLKKSMRFANRMNIPYTIIIGENEIQTKTVSVKDMDTGDKKVFDIEDYEGIKNFINC